MPAWWSLSVFVVVVWLGGYAVSNLLARVSSVTIWDRALFAFPLGGAVVGWIEFCGNEFGRLPITAAFVSVVTLPLAGLGAVFLVSQAREWWRGRGVVSEELTSRTQSSASQWTWLAWIELGIIILLLVRQVFESLVTPVLTYDALFYHLPFAKVIYQTHALPQFASPSVSDLVFASPPLLFLWYATGWLWLGKIHLFLPSVTALIFGGHLCVLVYQMARRVLRVDPQAALGAVLCLLLPGVFLTFLQRWGSTTDVPFAFCGMAATFFLLLDIIEGRANRWLWVGVWGAMACWMKPYAFGFGVVCIGGIVLEWWLSQRDKRKTWSYSLTIIGKLIVVWGGLVFPFLFRNWLHWDNPLYPAFGRLLGGYLVNDWTLQHNTILLDSYSWSVDGILVQLFKEPVVALTGLIILHPTIRRTSHLRIIWLIAVGYVLLYSILFGTKQNEMDHIRYLFPSIVLFGLLVPCFLDRHAYPVHGWLQWVLVGGFVAQVGRVGYELWTGTWHSTSLSQVNLNSFKAIAYEQLPFLLIGGFWGIALLFRRWPVGLIRLRLVLISGCCLFLVYPWPLTQPWELLLKPLQRLRVDWTAIPLISPYGEWVHTHLSTSAVLLTAERRMWIVPRQILPADSPLLQDLYKPEIPLVSKLKCLARLGVTHIVTGGTNGQPSPLQVGDPFNSMNPMSSFSWPFLQYPESERYFREVYQGPQVLWSQDPVGATLGETHLYEIVYPPQLQRLVKAPIPRPWLHEYATSGILKP